MNIAEYYKKNYYPDLDISLIEQKLSDPAVAETAIKNIHNTHYSDIPFEVFQQRIKPEPYVEITDIRTKDKSPFKASKQIISDIIKEAKATGVDPYTALALSFQETGLGDGWKDNPFHLSSPKTENVIRESLEFFKQKMDYGKKLGKKSEADIIQAWNGYGKITPNSELGGNMYYGVDVSKQPLDMNVNPVYGRRIVDIRDTILKNNKEIKSLVDSTFYNPLPDFQPYTK